MTIEEMNTKQLMAHRRKLVAYRDTLKHECERDTRIDTEYSIMLINNRLTELED